VVWNQVEKCIRHYFNTYCNGKSINNSSLNFIEKIGVLAVDNNGDCQYIAVDGNGCVASVGTTAITQDAQYNNSGIKVRKNK